MKATVAPGHGERQLSCPLFPLPTVRPVPTLQDLPRGHGIFCSSEARHSGEQPWGMSQCSWILDLPQTDLLLQGRRQQARDTFLQYSYLAGRERVDQTTGPGFKPKTLTSRRQLPVCSSRESCPRDAGCQHPWRCLGSCWLKFSEACAQGGVGSCVLPLWKAALHWNNSVPLQGCYRTQR